MGEHLKLKKNLRNSKKKLLEALSKIYGSVRKTRKTFSIKELNNCFGKRPGMRKNKGFLLYGPYIKIYMIYK